MTTAETILPAPRLLKARQFHSRIFGVAVVGLLLVTEPALASDSLLRMLMLWVGYALVIVGTFGRIYSTAYIGGKKNDEVVRSGPFGMVRNPLYVFSFIAAFGIGLQSGMASVLLLIIGAFIVYYPSVVAREEGFLRHKFGEAYDAYVRDVPRWLPKLAAWSEPEQVDAKPKFIRNSLKDAAVFFLPMPAFAILSLLHSHSILPVWLTLP